VGDLLVETGQVLESGQPLARTDTLRRPSPTHLHFAIRIHPYNRFDGWGGFSDPTPFLYVVELTPTATVNELEEEGGQLVPLPAMVIETSGLRRP
jgi:murein DD-endopeptidase MepM/ murein hydrolase activator NlpD